MSAAGPPYLARYRERRQGGGDGAVRAPFHRRRLRATGAVATASPEVVPVSPIPDDARVLDLHLVRHGETQSYLADAGLTPLGEWQSRRFGHGLASEVQEGERVRLLTAPAGRATRTADQVRLGLEDGLASRGRDVDVRGPEPAPEFRNFEIATPAGLLDPTRAAGEHRLALARPQPAGGGSRPVWELELRRFWLLQSAGGDPIEHWLTTPLLTFEAPSLVVRRFWEGALRLAAEGGQGRVVCCTHSGPMRAFATWALGHDAGEPRNVEEVRLRFWPELGRAMVAYRGRVQELDAPAW